MPSTKQTADITLSGPSLPVDVVLAPSWWHRHAGISFDADFFYHPTRRVEDERRMEEVLFERFGQWGLGEDRGRDLPQVGAVHLAAGFLVSEMLGCEIEYHESAPPEVKVADRDDLALSVEDAFASPAWRRFQTLLDTLTTRHGCVVGDVNWGGVLNLAIDLRGELIFVDMIERPEETNVFFRTIAAVIERFTDEIGRRTGSTSISVNRNVRHLSPPVFLHSECTHVMISVEDYEQFLRPIDIAWSRSRRPFGIHYCGEDPHRYAASFAGLPRLDFLDVGSGGDVAELRRHLPETFLNLRHSPVEIVRQTPAEIRENVRREVAASGDLKRTGVCCINVDDTVTDEQIAAIFETAEECRTGL